MPVCYCIISKDHQIYVGSTCRNLKDRLNEHQSECFNPERKSFYCTKYKHFRNCGMERDDLKMVELEWGSKKDILHIEAKWINKLGSLNEKSSIYDELKNHTTMMKRRARQFTCPCGGKWKDSHHKRHYSTNRHQKWEEEQEQAKLKYLYQVNEKKAKDNYEEAKKKHPRIVHLKYEGNQKIFSKNEENGNC